MMRRSKLSFKPRLEVLEDHLCPSGSGGSVPPGTIYYTDYKPLQSQFGWYDSFNGNDSMKADGTNKTALPNFPSSGEPSRLLHPDRWVLDLETVPGSYPNGLQRAEVFGTRLSDGFKLQLTNDPSVEPVWSRRWAFNDSFLSFDAVTWTPGTTGGDTTFTASSGQQWQVDAGIFRAAVTWTSGSPTAIAPTKMLDAGLHFGSSQDFLSFWPDPDVVGFDWSPGGNQVVYDQVTQPSPGGTETHYLRLTTFDTTGNPLGTIQLASIFNGGRFLPEWAPNGSRIAYDNGNSIWTVKPDGTGAVQVTTGGYDAHPDWSPDSLQIAFTRYTQTNQGGLTHYLKDVMRVAATGGTPVNLTKDVSDNTYVAAWRADVQTLTAATIGHRVTQSLRSTEVGPLLTEALARWQAAGVDTSALHGIDVRIADLGGTTLGLASGTTIWLDDNAAGWGWFVDPTPKGDSEFTKPGNQGEKRRMDLLTVLQHEVGHLLGKEHEATGVMIDTLPAGTRRVPSDGIDTGTRLGGNDLFVAFLDAEEETTWIGSSIFGRGRHKR